MGSRDFINEYRQKRKEQRREENTKEGMKRMAEKIDALGGDQDDK